MSRGELSADRLDTINANLADTVSLKTRVFGAPPDFVSMNFPHDSDFPIATVCLEDAADVLCDVRFALFEFYAHSQYYREVVTPSNEGVAVFMERFFLDDAVLRLYAAGEHLAKAITCMLGLTREHLSKVRKPRASLQATVGCYLISELPTHPITKAISRLSSSDSWPKARDYRDIWVHEQPPPIQGTGIIYPRKRSWRQTANGSWTLSLGQLPQPTLTIGDIHAFVKPSFDLFVSVFTECVEYYESRLREAGFTLRDDAKDGGAP